MPEHGPDRDHAVALPSIRMPRFHVSRNRFFHERKFFSYRGRTRTSNSQAHCKFRSDKPDEEREPQNKAVTILSHGSVWGRATPLRKKFHTLVIEWRDFCETRFSHVKQPHNKNPTWFWKKKGCHRCYFLFGHGKVEVCKVPIVIWRFAFPKPTWRINSKRNMMCHHLGQDWPMSIHRIHWLFRESYTITITACNPPLESSAGAADRGLNNALAIFLQQTEEGG